MSSIALPAASAATSPRARSDPGHGGDAWLSGWDPTEGIVSIWAEPDGRAFAFRRAPRSRGGALRRDDVRFRPWLLLASIDDLAAALGPHLAAEAEARPRGHAPARVTWRELDGPGALRFLVRADDERAITQPLMAAASRRLGRRLTHVRELGGGQVLCLPPEEQYLVASGRVHFRGLDFDDLLRVQIDLETTGLDPAKDRVFLVALRDPEERTTVLEAEGQAPAAEADLIRRVVAWITAVDPDVIENHHLHGFDLPFLAARARTLGVPLLLGRAPRLALARRPAARGAQGDDMRRARYTVCGRELIDTLDAVRRHDFAARDLPGHGLKVVARHLGVAAADREHVPGAQVFATWRRDPARVRRYAAHDVTEVAAIARLLGGACFALAGMVPRRYERLADAGTATGMLDPLLVRAYLHAGAALPAHEAGDGTPHQGAALHLHAAGVAERIVKADVASLYPSLIRQYGIGPRRDRLGVFVTLVDRLTETRLAAKARGRAAPVGSRERHAAEALSAAMKIVINSAYGYLGAAGLTRFSDVHAANVVTAHGRDVLALISGELAARGVTLLEADTDGVYFAVPPAWSEADERRAVAEVSALLPDKLALEHDGRYAAMLSHEPKNYALLGYDGRLSLAGVAFRSRRAEPYGEAFLRRALACLLAGDVAGVRAAFVAATLAVRRRALATAEVSARVRLSKTPAEYAATRAARRELAYEALWTAGRQNWQVGERVRVYRGTGGRPALFDADRAEGPASDDTRADADGDPRDYDTDYYARLLADSFAARLARAFRPDDFATLFADPTHPALFARDPAEIVPVLTMVPPPE